MKAVHIHAILIQLKKVLCGCRPNLISSYAPNKSACGGRQVVNNPARGHKHEFFFFLTVDNVLVCPNPVLVIFVGQHVKSKKEIPFIFWMLSLYIKCKHFSGSYIWSYELSFQHFNELSLTQNIKPSEYKPFVIGVC